ncbi:MAG: hypothetical protein WCG27_10725 [Pseudomonadota bacterium]
MLVTIILFMVAMHFAPKKFKSTFIFDVNPQYYNSPLLSDIIPTIQPGTEMRNSIETMVRQTLSDSYLDQIAQALNLSINGDETIEQQRQQLKDRFEIIPLAGQSMQVSFIYNNAQDTQTIASLTAKAITDFFTTLRENNLLSIREALSNKVKKIILAQKLSQDKTNSSNKQELVMKLEQKKSYLESIAQQFRSGHPQIISLKNEIQSLEEKLNNFPTEDSELSILATQGMQELSQLLNRLTMQLQNINLVLELGKAFPGGHVTLLQRPELPQTPLWPKKRFFLMLGLAMGVIFCFAYLFVLEIIEQRQKREMTTGTPQIDLDFEDFPETSLPSFSSSLNKSSQERPTRANSKAPQLDA